MKDLDDQQPSEKDVQREDISNAPTEKCLENVEFEKYVDVAISDYRTSVNNIVLSSPVQYNASRGNNSGTIIMVSFRHVTWIKLWTTGVEIASGTEMTLILKENTTPLMES
ncbi:hypothetical protein TNCV_1496511 [Trichonephila clavipes]|nr:hypothetical protein TNCV_1496511 [Trichonephila clavipes]